MIPDTRPSLIVRLADPRDGDAWSEFTSIYRPVVYWQAREQGLQDADAEDVVQQVMTSISRALAQRPHDHHRAKFRTWLYCVTRNAITNAIQRRPPDRGSGDTDQQEFLNQFPWDEGSREWQQEFQKAVFQWAAQRVKPEFTPESWQAFWMTAVEGASCDDAARALGKEIGSIYAARSRIVRRIKQIVAEFDDSCQDL